MTYPGKVLHKSFPLQPQVTELDRNLLLELRKRVVEVEIRGVGGEVLPVDHRENNGEDQQDPNDCLRVHL